jgi:hypothetical protein
MKRIVRLTESDLARIVRRVINEQAPTLPKVPNLEFPNYTFIFRYDASDDSIICRGYIKNPQRALKQLDSPVVKGSDYIMRISLHGWGMQSQFDGTIGRKIKETLDDLLMQIAEYKKKKPTQQ